MRRFTIFFIVASLMSSVLSFAAHAETFACDAYTLELPDEFVVISDDEVEGYIEAANEDTGAEYETHILLAKKDTASLVVQYVESGYEETSDAVEAILQEYANYIEGFEDVEPEIVEAEECEFYKIQIAIDGEAEAQYFLVEQGTLFILTFVGVEDADEDAILDSFVPVWHKTPEDKGTPDAQTAEPNATDAEPDATDQVE